MAAVFISYRREDSQWVSGRIYDALASRYGRDHVFKDVYTIPLGIDFRAYIGQQVSQCDIMLVIIGPQWLTLADATGLRRLDDPADFARVEIEQALQRGIPVIPELVDGTRMPRADELPESLVPLAFRNATTVRDADFPTDIERILTAIEQHEGVALPAAASPTVAPPPPLPPTSPGAPQVTSMPGIRSGSGSAHQSALLFPSVDGTRTGTVVHRVERIGRWIRAGGGALVLVGFFLATNRVPLIQTLDFHLLDDSPRHLGGLYEVLGWLMFLLAMAIIAVSFLPLKRLTLRVRNTAGLGMSAAGLVGTLVVAAIGYGTNYVTESFNVMIGIVLLGFLIAVLGEVFLRSTVPGRGR